MLKDLGSVRRADGGQTELRHPFAQAIDAQDPLLDRFVPVLENQAAGCNFTRQNPGRFIDRRTARQALFQHQIAEAFLDLGHDAQRSLVEDNGSDFIKIRGKKLVQPLFSNRRGEIEHDAQGSLFAAAAFHLTDIGGDEQRRFDNALARQQAAPAVHQLAP